MVTSLFRGTFIDRYVPHHGYLTDKTRQPRGEPSIGSVGTRSNPAKCIRKPAAPRQLVPSIISVMCDPFGFRIHEGPRPSSLRHLGYAENEDRRVLNEHLVHILERPVRCLRVEAKHHREVEEAYDAENLGKVGMRSAGSTSP